MRIDRRNVVGMGGLSNVFAGTYEGEKVAIKRVQLMDSRHGKENDLERSVKIWQNLNHPNIVHLKHFEKNNDFG